MTVADLVLIYMANAIWQVSILAIVALAIAPLFRNTTARSTHLFWVAVLVITASLPLLSLTGESSGGSGFSIRLPIVTERAATAAEASNVETVNRPKETSEVARGRTFPLSF